jgi:predicted RNA binding protein YcfA (HicA-like mRNA interferase family)
MKPDLIESGEQIVELLERMGFVVARVNGRHRIMRHADGRATTVPVHSGQPLAPETLNGISLDVGMTRHPAPSLVFTLGRFTTAIRRRLSRR